MEEEESPGFVLNFRQASNLPDIYRSASLDGLSQSPLLVTSSFSKHSASPTSLAERIVLLHHGPLLILDLRSPAERSRGLKQKRKNPKRWMKGAHQPISIVKWEIPFRDETKQHDQKQKQTFDGEFHLCDDSVTSKIPFSSWNEVVAYVVDVVGSSVPRLVLQVDLLSPRRLFRYMERQWSSSLDSKIGQSSKSMPSHDDDNNKQQRLIRTMKELNARGLPGLYQAMLVSSQPELCFLLMTITSFLEQTMDHPPFGKIIIHCVQGKDRTGILVVLCQSILGLDQEIIVNDYHQSERRTFGLTKTTKDISLTSSAAATTATATTVSDMDKSLERPRLDGVVFGGAPRSVMKQTIQWIRQRYGSVCPGFMNNIGFDDSWQCRLKQVLLKRQIQTSRL